MKTIAAGEFKAKCLALLDEVNRDHETLVVTKRGKPVAKVAPILKTEYSHKVSLRGSVIRETDIIGSMGETWDADK